MLLSVSMRIEEITAKSLLRKQKQVDSWFCCAYGMNIYRGCSHNCTYCDGRAETYRVEGDFGSDISVKVNAPELLAKELDPKRKRKPMKRAFIFIGGGVNDAYQPAEERFQLTRRALEIIRGYGLAVHVLTKSVLVERDIDLLKMINSAYAYENLFDAKNTGGAVISFSFSTVDDSMSKVFEPGVPPPSRRIEAIKRLKDAGLSCGIYLLPILPFITDSPEQIDAVFKAVKNAGADFLVFGGLTLKEGRQKEHFMEALRNYGASVKDGSLGNSISTRTGVRNLSDPALQYDMIYRDDPYGNARPDYLYMLNELVFAVARPYRIPLRMPPSIFGQVMDENDKIGVMLEHMDYFHRARGYKSTFGWAARKVRELEVPLRSMADRLRSVSGIGPASADLIREILATGTSPSYEKLLYGGMR